MTSRQQCGIHGRMDFREELSVTFSYKVIQTLHQLLFFLEVLTHVTFQPSLAITLLAIYLSICQVRLSQKSIFLYCLLKENSAEAR